jgi:Family of unknown function (DUF5954)
VRADTFIRGGRVGPGLPSPSNPDPGEAGRAHELADPAGFVIDPVTATGMAEGVLKVELLEAVYPDRSVPAEVRADSVLAVRAYPGGSAARRVHHGGAGGRAVETDQARDGGETAGCS